MNRIVTERDFREDEFKDADPKDYEFRGDGKVVRKDRWERGIRSIAGIVGFYNDFEISDIVEEVRNLAAKVNEDEDEDDGTPPKHCDDNK